MFALRRSCIRVKNGVIKCIHQSSASRARDPGIGKRSKFLEPSELVDVDFDDLESDFMDVHKSHKQFIRDIEDQNERLKYLIVKRKYFKQKYPNFLTWHDKEQIKYLHSTNPEEWTIDRLSESFPALPEIIQKVIRAKYTKNELKVARHDEAVERNWTMFKKGEISDLPDDLVEHLKKFTSRSRMNRTSNLPSDKKEVTNLSNRLHKGEFSEIIASYQKLRKAKEPENCNHELILQPKKDLEPTPGDSYLTTTVHSTNLVTLRSLEQKIQKRASKGGSISEEDKVILLQSQKTSESSQRSAVVLNEEDLTDILENKYETKAVSPKVERDYSHLVYPEKIKIPKDKVKRGMTYKLNDCYYDTDGTFLYRVPGMY